MTFSLADYPTSIEPTVAILEAQVGNGSDPSADRWAPLYRVPTSDVQQLVPTPSGVVHFFGRSVVAEENTEFLCYNVGGLLSHILYRSGDQWEMSTVPAEIVGQSLVSPSVRLVFKTPRGRNAFLRYMQQVVDGQVSNPSMEMMLTEHLAEPVRVLDVYSIDNE